MVAIFPAFVNWLWSCIGYLLWKSFKQTLKQNYLALEKYSLFSVMQNSALLVQRSTLPYILIYSGHGSGTLNAQMMLFTLQ